MGVGAVLVEGPGGLVGSGPHRDVPDHRHPHIRVRLQTEGEDGDADVEYRDHTDHLGRQTSVILNIMKKKRKINFGRWINFNHAVYSAPACELSVGRF